LIEQPLPTDIPLQRQPVIALAQQELGWQPKASVEQWLEPTIFWFKKLL
jgi:UDP-glucuronate decarboxylase